MSNIAMLAALFGTTPRAFRDDLCLNGDRIFLRPRTLEDDAALFAYASDPEIIRFLPWDPAPNVEAVRSFIAESRGRRKKYDAMDFAIVLRETGDVIGQTDLMDLKGIRGQAELGYIVARPYWNRGLMTEAASLTLTYAFGSLHLNRVIAYADSENIASQRVMQKIGMRRTGSETRFVKGEQRPYVRYDVTRAEWNRSA